LDAHGALAGVVREKRRHSDGDAGKGKKPEQQERLTFRLEQRLEGIDLLTSANSRHFVAKSANRTCGSREPALKRRKGDFR
jgi:hypothetical protein